MFALVCGRSRFTARRRGFGLESAAIRDFALNFSAGQGAPSTCGLLNSRYFASRSLKLL
jgi:hypothetical protein